MPNRARSRDPVFVPDDRFPLRALDMLKLVAPALRRGAVVVTDNVGVFQADHRDDIACVRAPRHGFASRTVPFRSGAEASAQQSASPD